MGDPVAATDLDTDNADNGALIYSLGGTDAASFSIIRTSGQITTKAELDYETKKTYKVTVKALDPSGASATIPVTINVTNVDEAPELSKKGLVAVGAGNISYEENGRGVVAEYAATGPNAANVSWSLSGPDAGDFSINRAGQLTFRRSPNFEAPADSNTDNTYEITLTARSGNNRDGLDVTVRVTNVDEEGEVALSPARGNIGAQLTATLTDPDGTPTGVSWDWARSKDGATGWTNILGTNSNIYTPDSDDVGHYLRATANYTDPEGPGKSASARTSAALLADDDGRVTLSETRPGIGDTVTATLTDPDGSITNRTWQWASSSDGESGWTNISGATSATYTVVAADLGYFLRATANYDDGEGADKSALGVTSAAVVEDDDGSVTLSPSSPSVGDRVTATLTDPDGGVTEAIWQWAYSSNGTSNWTDIAGATSRTYTVVSDDLGSYLQATVSYDDAAGAGKIAEAITAAAITADDDGSVALSPTGPSDGDRVTARLTDPDGGVTGVTWTWASSPNGLSGWRDILNATSATYTPVTTDVGRYLRATATYTDAAGPGKSAEAVTAAAITADDDGSVALSPTGPSVGDRVTARLTDPDGGVTGVTWTWASSPNGLSGWRDILNATSATYTPVTTDVGRYLRATATYTDAVGPGKSAESLPSSPIIADDDGVVTLSPSAPEHGAMITATLDDPDSGVTGVTWQWARSADGQTGWIAINGATSATYTPVVANVGSYFRATARYTDSVGPDKSARAVTSASVRIDDDGTVSLSWEELTVGEAVTASLTDPDDGVMNVEWQWASSADGLTDWTDIVGATSGTYTPVEGNVNNYLRATASYDDDAGIGKSARAVTSAAVIADDDGSVTLSTSAPEVGAAVTATLSDPDGGVTGATWQWEKSSNGSAGWTDIQGATSASYTPGESDAGIFLRATASYDDAVGTGKSAQAATSSGVAQMELLSEYDANRNESIERSEAIRAVSDYFDGEISKDDVLAVLVLYFSG